MGEQPLQEPFYIANSHFGTKRKGPYQIQECPAAVVQLTERVGYQVAEKKDERNNLHIEMEGGMTLRTRLTRETICIL